MIQLPSILKILSQDNSCEDKLLFPPDRPNDDTKTVSFRKRKHHFEVFLLNPLLLSMFFDVGFSFVFVSFTAFNTSSYHSEVKSSAVQFLQGNVAPIPTEKPTVEQLKLPAGRCIGKLVVTRGGRVYLRAGGHSMDVAHTASENQHQVNCATSTMSLHVIL